MKTNKWALVTGADTNTGFAIARRFAMGGFGVFLHSLSQSKAERAVRRLLKEDRNSTIIPVWADFRDHREIPRMMRQVRQHSTRLDVLVNNAVHQAIGYEAAETPYAVVRAAVSVNLEGLYFCIQHSVQIMRRQKHGVIINLGSNTAERAIRGRSIYIATKGAVESLSRALSLELSPYKIRVNTVVPGYIHSDRWQRLPASVVRRRRANIPLGCEASPTDVAEAVYFLSMDQAAMITGARLVVDGGCLAQLYPKDVEG